MKTLSQFCSFYKDSNGTDQSNVDTPCNYITGVNGTSVNANAHLNDSAISTLNHNREHSKRL